jgi:tetraacyldisaccharide 4'-kinase
VRLLAPLELLYRGVTRSKRSLYRRGLLRARRLPRPVVSIGNLSFGGSGKTPLTIAIGRSLLAAGLRVAVLTRGYGRRGRRGGAVVDSASDPRLVGDEPLLLARSIPLADVVVGADRWRAATAYLEEHDCDVFLLDDGFQHLRLARDVDVVIDDPAARYRREGRPALRDADIVLERLRGEPPSAAAAFTLDLVPSAVLLRGRRLSVDWLDGRRVAAFSALADNEQFFAAVEELGGKLVLVSSFRDHHEYVEEEVEAICSEAEARGAEATLTTAKDQVKIPERGLGVLEVEAAIEPEAEFFARLLSLLDGAREHREEHG